MSKFGKSENIGVTFNVKISGNAFMNIIAGVGKVLGKHGYLLLFVGSPLNNDNVEACIKIAEEKRADGIIFLSKIKNM